MVEPGDERSLFCRNVVGKGKALSCQLQLPTYYCECADTVVHHRG